MKITIKFQLFVGLFCFINSTFALECNICEPRNFGTDKHEDCYCLQRQFCNETAGTCNDCGECFNFWDNVVKKRKDDINTTLEKLIKKYEIDLKALQRNLSTLSNIFHKQESQLKILNKLSDTVIENILSKIQHLHQYLDYTESKLKAVIFPKNLEKLLKIMTDLKSNINDIYNKLENTTDPIDKSECSALKQKLKEISGHVQNAEETMPQILFETLNLPFETECDLDLLQSVLSQNHSFNVSTRLENLDNLTKWIESELMTLINIIQQFSLNYTALYKPLTELASKLKASANDAKSNLQILIKEQQRSEQLFSLLKTEKKYYDTISQLTVKLEETNAKITSLEDLLRSWDDLNALNEELIKYDKEVRKLNKKVNAIYKYQERLDKILKEKQELLEIYQKIKNVKPINEIRKEIMLLLLEIEEITNDINSHCNRSKLNTKP